MPTFTIATRGSMLALWQAEHIKARILEHHGATTAVNLLVIKTTGDKILDAPLAKVGGKGLFVKEIEEALLDGRADLAVHSMKDVPAELPEGLVLGVVPRRENPADAFLSVHYSSLAELPPGARLGTSSLRRQSQALALRPDLRVASLRGNVDTRLRKLMDEEFDGIIMAAAGLKRLGLAAPKQELLGPPAFLPAVGQGALGIEYRRDQEEVARLLAFLDHEPTRCRVNAERAFLTTLEGGCQVPIAGFAEFTETGELRLSGMVADLAGEQVIRVSATGPRDRAEDLGRGVARDILERGGREILNTVYGRTLP